MFAVKAGGPIASSAGRMPGQDMAAQFQLKGIRSGGGGPGRAALRLRFPGADQKLERLPRARLRRRICRVLREQCADAKAKQGWELPDHWKRSFIEYCIRQGGERQSRPCRRRRRIL